MASINATTSSGIVATADNTGQLQLQSAGTTIATISSTGLTMNSGNIIQASGAAPAFSAYTASVGGATIGTAATKATFDTEEFDTNNNFASSRFTPTVAGYYQINAQLQPRDNYTGGWIGIYKNGSLYKYGTFVNVSVTFGGFTVSSVVPCNGSTDFIEIYAAFTTSQPTNAGQQFSYFNGCFLRSL